MNARLLVTTMINSFWQSAGVGYRYLRFESLRFKIHYVATLFTILTLASVQNVSSQCTNTPQLSSNGASIGSSGTAGLCLFCSVSGTANLIDADLTDFATISIPVGVGGSGYVSIKMGQTYPAGTRAGFVADVNGGIAGLFNGISLIPYLNGVAGTPISSGSLFNILGLGGGTNISAVFCQAFDEVRISAGSLAGVLASYRIYYAYATPGCSFPVQCGNAVAGPEICGNGIDDDGDGLIDSEDVCITCSAGTTAPALSATTKSNVCPVAAVDLSTITVSNTPAGATLTWHTGTPATTANKITTGITSLSAGSYYAAFFDATNNCYSTSTTMLTAITNVCLLDNDGDGVSDATDLDDDNDGILDSDECSAVERFTTQTFPNTGGGTSDITAVTGWTLTGVNGTTPLFSQSATAINFNTDNVLQSASQSLTKVYPNSSGLIPVTIVFRMSNSIDASNSTSFLVQYGATGSEVTYATMATTTGSGTTGTVTYSNGASGNLTTFAMGTTLHTLTINLPTSVANSGNFKVVFAPSGRNITGTIQQKSTDDGSLYSVSFQSCQDTDNDNIPNIIDLDSDGDGCSDANEYYNISTASGTDGGAYGTGTPAVDGTGKVTAASYTGSYTNVVNSGVATACVVPVSGVIDCSKTEIYEAPVVGTPSQLDLIVTINVTAVGTFTPLSVSGSGISLANGITSVSTTATGIQKVHIPIKYDGTALGTVNFTIGSAGSCAANLAATPTKKVLKDIWTLDNCAPIMGPGIK